jgi:hypothetical protein
MAERHALRAFQRYGQKMIKLSGGFFEVFPLSLG